MEEAKRLVFSSIEDKMVVKKEMQNELALVRWFARAVGAEFRHDGREHFLLKRYLRAARGHRSRAFEA